jgi:AmmeMemoRadiSam system protein B
MNLRPSIAGTWYPSKPDELRGLLRDCLDLVPDKPGQPPDPRALLVPHAGYAYSGRVAAPAYALLKHTRRRLVVLLGPIHAYADAPFLICGHEGYQTPFGPVPIDRETVQRIQEALLEESGFGLRPITNAIEHSIEIQLPFLQTIFGEFRLAPIMLADQTPPTVASLARALTRALGDLDPLLIASSDLSHFHSHNLATLMDQEMLRRILALDADGVLRAETEGAGAACGAGAIAAVILAARAFGAQRAELLRYRTSADVTGDFHSVVGYASAAFW